MKDEWILVPKDPTEEMMRASVGIFAVPEEKDALKIIYQRMIHARPAAPSPWRPIESAPKDEKMILVYSTLFGIDIDSSKGPNGENGHRLSVTHWMPLPEPPEERE
jgi:hypothetical protein